MIVGPGLIRGTPRFTRGRQIFNRLNPTRYVSPGVLAAPFTITRAQTAGVESTGLSSDGVTWQTYGADTPRFFGPEQALAMESQRVNSIRNPRFEGATPGIVGAGGVIPTRFVWQPAAGHTLNIIGVTTVNGLPTLEVEFVATGAGQSVLSFELSSGVALSGNRSYVFSVLAALVGGSLTNVDLISIRHRIDATTAFNGPNVFLTGLTPALQRYNGGFLTAASGQTAGRMQFVWNTTGPATTRLRFAAPQFELVGAVAYLNTAAITTPIFPAVGAPNTSTRGGEIISAPLSGLGISNLAQGGGCTVLWAGNFFWTSYDAQQTILAIDESTNQNRFEARLGRNAEIELVQNIGGSPVLIDSLRPAFVPSGRLIKVGLSVDPTGRASAVFDGFQNSVAIEGGPVTPTAALTTLRLGGSGATAARAMQGQTRALYVAPTALNSSDLSAAVMAMPV